MRGVVHDWSHGSFVLDSARRRPVAPERLYVDRVGERGYRRSDADAGSFVPSLSGDGRYVAFASNASDLVADDGNGTTDIFVRDLRTGTTTRVSTNVQGGDANGHSDDAAISADGRYAAFTSVASNLVAAGDNCCTDVFVRDLHAGTTMRLGTTSGTNDLFSHSFNPTLSADGRFVVFESWASDLVPGDNNGVVDVFVYDQHLGVIGA